MAIETQPIPSQAAEAAAPVVAAIRAASAERRLIRISALASQFPGVDVAALVGDSGEVDLKKIAGDGDLYFFSDLSMTDAYALHLYRVEENDPGKLIAGIVRDDSRIYPRPTDLRTFLDPPFSLSQKTIDETLGRMSLRPDMVDIRSCRASNGAVYLFSTEFLGELQAEALTEWFEVGLKENP